MRYRFPIIGGCIGGAIGGVVVYLTNLAAVGFGTTVVPGIALADPAGNGYAEGQLIAMEDVKDETFANKVLGDGVAVIPEQGKVYAPADGTITSIFDTKHAVCFASTYGTEILIHIGVDTVKLEGKHFTAHVKDGDLVKKGQLLVEFDKEAIERAGYDTVIPMIFTDLPDEKKLEISAPGKMTVNTAAAVVCKV